MSDEQSRRMILVVDDQQSVCETVAMILRSRGYVVYTANNGRDALRRLEDMRLDLVISDLNMPGMSGWELISAIRSRFPGVPVVTMSGAYAADRLPGNLSTFYAKGEEPEQLLSIVEELLSRRHNPVRVKDGKRHLRRGKSAA